MPSGIFGKVKNYMRAHKIISAIVVIVLVWGGYYFYSKNSVAPTVTKYVVQNAAQGSVIASVSGSGQVQAVL